ncbi:calcium-binding protein [Chenggangzhangella methanolivorans]|uniref:Calcium-binding protein n=1 Tax=Chenggangzhangella methanolivorans TaxID=1437009 RepID=A0A9E6RBX9_9HYPH|nr:hypothetical protein [Chenggangzhangella methanolivorans]QZN98265.1 hypothetical protein K6K41_14005 [Chenggangzhangella methanolivorans]
MERQSLSLDGLLDGVVDLLDDLLGGDLGDVVKDLSPGDLIKDLGKTLEAALGGGDSKLLDSLLDNKVIDPLKLQEVLNGGDLDLGELQDLLGGADLGHLEDVLDDVFDNGLLGLGETELDLDALGDLTGVDLEAVVTYVTGLVGAVLKTAGEATDLEDLLDVVLAGDDKLVGDSRDNTIHGGAGDDDITGKSGADTLAGDEGDDRLNGGGGQDRLLGGDGSDVLIGGGGSDSLDGGSGADVMKGGGGDDLYTVDDAGDVVIEGANGGRDTVESRISYELGDNVERLTLLGGRDIDGVGNDLNNRLVGNRGDNELSGGAGKDIILGGRGADVLSGGSGDDIFKFGDVHDSGIGKKADVIVDFEDGDRINLKGVDANPNEPNDQAFDFIGKGDFSGDGDGEIRYSFKGGDTLVRIDADGDGETDMSIRLEGHHKLDAGDFVL